MNQLKYVTLDKVDIDDFKNLLNKQKIREHLMEHELFNSDSVRSWVTEKIKVDSSKGCRVRGIYFNNALAGWCGIQLEEGEYEIAIVIDAKFWGIGKKVFIEMLGWAKEFKHDDVYIHFLHTRPEYRFLRKISKNISKTEMFGHEFTTYQLSVAMANGG